MIGVGGVLTMRVVLVDDKCCLPNFQDYHVSSASKPNPCVDFFELPGSSKDLHLFCRMDAERLVHVANLHLPDLAISPRESTDENAVLCQNRRTADRCGSVDPLKIAGPNPSHSQLSWKPASRY